MGRKSELNSTCARQITSLHSNQVSFFISTFISLFQIQHFEPLTTSLQLEVCKVLCTVGSLSWEGTYGTCTVRIHEAESRPNMPQLLFLDNVP